MKKTVLKTLFIGLLEVLRNKPQKNRTKTGVVILGSKKMKKVIFFTKY